MFKAQSVPVVASVAAPDPSELVALSVLGLDVPAPASGWEPFLAVRDVVIVVDDLGRPSVARVDARRLLSEHQEQQAAFEVRRREIAERQAAREVEAERVRLSQLWGGIPVSEGLTGTEALLAAAAADSPQRRVSPVEAAFSNAESVTYHPWPSEE